MSSNFSWWKLNLLVSVLWFSSTANADEPSYQLVYKFKSGQFFYTEADDKCEMTMQNATVQNKAGEPFESKSRQQTQMFKSFRVVTTDEHGGAILEPIVEKVRMAAQVDERTIVRFDSTTGETPPKEYEMLAGTLGRSLARFHISSNGQLLKVTLLVTDVPKNFSEAAEKADPNINFLIVLPDHPVKIGDKWSEKFETPVSISDKLTRKMNMVKGYELIKVENQIATIRVRTNLLTPTEDPEILRQLAQMISTGTVEFDIQHGHILTKTIQIDEKVIGAFGVQTVLHAKGESVEKTSSKNPGSRVANGAPDVPSLLPK